MLSTAVPVNVGRGTGFCSGTRSWELIADLAPLVAGLTTLP